MTADNEENEKKLKESTDNNTKKDDEYYKKKLEESRAKFDILYQEFKRKKLTDSPCTRSTFLTAIPTGLIVGILAYLWKSNFRFAGNCGYGSFGLVGLGYFTMCRIEYNQKVKENKELSELMNMITKYRGTELEAEFQKKYKEKLTEMDSKSKYV